MKIVVTRSGGFGGLTRTWSLEVSRSEAEQRWLPLAEAEPDHAEPDHTEPRTAPSASPGVSRDRFTYLIAIGYTEVYLPESELDDPWRELIDRARAATSAQQAEPAKAAEGSRGIEDAGPGPSPELL